AQLLLGLEDAVAAAQATQRDRVTGQTSLFDIGAAESALFERPLPAATEVPMRERLRWEKELLGLYLSEHPMGEVAEQVGRFVNAYSGDLKDEALDGQRVVVGGIVTGLRTVVTKRQESMAIATIEDLQGSIEVVVFPRLYETTRATWRDGAILLVAGRVDHKGEEVSLLADLAADWDDAVLRGPEVFAREVAAGDRSGGRGANGQRRQIVAAGPGRAAAGGPGVVPGSGGPGVPGAPGSLALATQDPGTLPPIRPAEPVSTYIPGPGSDGAGDDSEESAVPDEARARILADASADAPIAAGPDTILHVRFESAAAPDRLVSAMEQFRSLLRDRPGSTRVVIHVPTPGGGGSLPMELRLGVAYDTELVAEVRRRLGEGLVDLRLASA
ncbi:MAG TPA: OB-fold nucleic acid binding domain-containing protein, partial [Candidatus Sulfomarinibacteraceae bacterium]|nr:OB-fold nucleic acid binding domain-containing protein [Candidatus Sulfomarinibacteraceae bacterium]